MPDELHLDVLCVEYMDVGDNVREDVLVGQRGNAARFGHAFLRILRKEFGAADMSKELLNAANDVLSHFMPTFPDSRAVDDCLVRLAAAVVDAEKILPAPETTEQSPTWAFVERVATYCDYTHDDVDELKILYDLQAAAKVLYGDGSSPPHGTIQQTGWWQCPCCQNYYTPERIVCPVSGDARPTAVKAGASLPPCECFIRDKEPSAYHATKCPRFVAGAL